MNLKLLVMKNTPYRNRDRERRRDNDREDYREENNRYGMEDPSRNEDYYYSSNQHNGYSNRDYDDRNYWPSDRFEREERRGQANSYPPSHNYGRDYRSENNEATFGYGNQGSRSMRDYEQPNNQQRYDEGGYRGRDARDYRNDEYGGYRYDPSEYDRGGRRRNYEAENFNRMSDQDRKYDEWQSRERYSYGDYESYPSYPTQSRNADDNWPRQSERHRSRGDYGRRSDGRDGRPGIREKRY